MILFELVACLLAVLVFLVVVGRTPWYRSFLGWAIMIQKTSFGIVFCLGIAGELFGTDWPGRFIVRASVFGVFVVVFWTVTLYAIYLQTHGRSIKEVDREDLDERHRREGRGHDGTGGPSPDPAERSGPGGGVAA